MSLDDNKRLVRRVYDEMVMGGHFDNLEELIHDDYVDYTQPPGWPMDREGLRLQVEYFRRAFPDIHVQFEEMIAEGDLVIHRQIMSGTQRGEFFGIVPTGNHVEMAGYHMLRIKDGKLIEHRAVNDDLGMLRQLGVIPAEPDQVEV